MSHIMTRTHNLEEAIGWAGLRAMLEAVSKAPEIPVSESMFIEVKISLHSDTWPGKTESGRNKASLIGSASCLYGRAKDGDQ